MGKSIIDEIENLKKIVENAKKVPFSKYITIDRDEILGILIRIEAMLPDEVKQAVNITKQRDMILQDAYEEKERILKEAEVEFKKKVSESNIIAEAKREKEEIINNAKAEAEHIKKDALQFANDVLSKIEGVLEKALSTIKESKEEISNEITNR
ncbi:MULTISPECIES: hypothetical protein [Caldisericum]|jgi:vacuolar-type H+-ATPase subunit H|uniref:ATPase n=1 Tax=Thermodesulfobacterium geofontis TaxID=1295609 RepID=A0A2N7QBA9_9BACT|nr:MAG: hypothetical protein C0169_05190 [Thermodesulfobacterium geofontis]